MRTLLSLVLSFTLLFSSVSPSLAQALSAAGKAGRSFANVGKNVSRAGSELSNLSRAATQTSRVATEASAASRTAAAARTGISSVPTLSVQPVQVPSVLPGRVSSPSLETTVTRAFSAQLPKNVNSLREEIRQGQIDGIAQQILTYPDKAARASLMRQELVTVALRGGAYPVQMVQAVKFYKEDLTKASKAFAQFPQKDLAAVLAIANDFNNPAFKALFQSQEALSDAAALGLFGTKEDAAALVEFYNAAANSAFKDVAGVIAARGLLRMGAEKELGELAAKADSNGIFWQETSSLARERGLAFTPVEGLAEVVPAEELSAFLKSGCRPNALNADFSAEATQKWLNIRVQPRAPFTARPETPRPVTEPAPKAEIPALDVADVNLSAAPVEVAPSGSAVPTTEATTPAVVASSNSGVLYSGLPVFAMGNAISRAAKWFKNRFSQPEAKATEEEPGLHDNTEIQEVYNTLRSPEAPASADEVIGAGDVGPVSVSEKGFKLTLIDANGVERILPVNLEISNRFRVKGYNRVAFTAHSDFKHGYVAELRNQTKEPERMAHFYMRLQSNQVGDLVRLMNETGLDKFSLKLEATANVAYKTDKLPVFDLAGKELPLEVEVPQKEIPAGAKIVLMNDGSLGMLREGAKSPEALSKFYVRLPKNQISNFVQILSRSTMPFNVSVHPTQNRADLIIRDASLTNVSLGKTMGPVVKGSLGISDASATSMMFTINYVLPGLASLLTPVLKKYGEKNLMVLSLAMSTAAGTLASAGGFYGFVEGMTLGPVSKGLFITALFLMSGSSILKQLVSNMLIRANRGEVILDAAKDAVKKSETEFTAVEKQGFARMGERLKEFFTKKSDVSLKDVVLYNLSFVYKNVGTLAFLASPYLINKGIQLASGVDLGLDYSVSFPLYAGYSGWVAWKVHRAKLRDAYSAKNLEQSQKVLAKTLNSGAEALAKIEGEITSLQIDDAARAFKESLDALAFATVKVDGSKSKSAMYKQEKAQLLADLRTRLIESKMSATKADDVVARVEASMNVQENTFGNMFKMAKAPGVTALATAMTLATVHEFVVSSSFSSTMKGLIEQGEFANFLIASSLYLPMIVGRLGGNIVGRRISAESMYIASSALSAIGTGMMITGGGNVFQTIAGASVASLGMGNYFTQMYDYIMNRYPKQNRELSSILALTMALGGLGAIPAGYMASGVGFDPTPLFYASGALGISLMLTPEMMANSTLVKGFKYEAKRAWNGLKKLFGFGGKNGGNNTPNLDNPAPAN